MCRRTVACCGCQSMHSLSVLVLAIYSIHLLSFILFLYIIRGNVTLWSVLLDTVKLTYP
uniref:Uncharacterized protein n=1 Tax=Arundo donax TaxID=35708 RepID=A0A0A9C1J9_ARUDO